MRVFLVQPEAGLAPDVHAALVQAAEQAGHELLPPLPIHHAGVAASERNRFLTAVDQMMEADLLLADVSAESHSVGWCLGWFLARGRLAVLTCRQDARLRLSPMLAGNPSPWQKMVTYGDVAQLRQNLGEVLRF